MEGREVECDWCCGRGALPEEVVFLEVLFGERDVFGGGRKGGLGEELTVDVVGDVLDADFIEAGFCVRSCGRGQRGTNPIADGNILARLEL